MNQSNTATNNLMVELTEAQAWAFAQLLKRVATDDYRRLAKNDDEAYAMRDAGDALRSALAAHGYAPR